MITIELPIYWTQHFKTKQDKTVLVGMNWYRNAFYRLQNSMKKDFHSLVQKQLNNAVIDDQYRLHLSLYYKNASCDGANIIALIEKFTLDALQDAGVVVNDNVKYHVGSTWEIIEQDKDNPRCIVTILPTKTDGEASA